MIWYRIRERTHQPNTQHNNNRVEAKNLYTIHIVYKMNVVFVC